jgi:hypothetical protein
MLDTSALEAEIEKKEQEIAGKVLKKGLEKLKQ